MVMVVAVCGVIVGLEEMAFWYNAWHSLSVEPALVLRSGRLGVGEMPSEWFCGAGVIGTPARRVMNIPLARGVICKLQTDRPGVGEILSESTTGIEVWLSLGNLVISKEVLPPKTASTPTAAAAASPAPIKSSASTSNA